MGKVRASRTLNQLEFVSSLQRSLLLSLGWVTQNLRGFSVGHQASTSFTKSDAARIKPISELALTICILQRCGVDVPIMKRLVHWMWAESEGGLLLARLLLARNDFLPCCSFYASMYELGISSEVLHSILGGLTKSDFAHVLPLQPWAHLALSYNLWKLGIVASPVDNRNLYVVSRPEPWVVSGEVGYAITHEVFYLSDFGFKVIKDKLLLQYLRTWIPYWSKIFAKEDDCDLVGELAMVGSCIGLVNTSEHQQSMSWLLKHQSPDGSIPGPKGAGLFLENWRDSPGRRRFLGRYHTTLVTMMAVAMSLRNFQ
jgi:Domain of unknown function (DUF6895)